MHRLRIKGLVREADRLRQRLAMPMTASQRDSLAAQLRRSLQTVDDILRRHGTTAAHLPPLSRRAYDFLRQIDLDHVKLVDAPPGTNGHVESVLPESVAFRGLRAFLERILDDAAIRLHGRQFDAAASLWVIRQTAGRLDHAVSRDGLTPGHLKAQARELTGWFRYFSDATNWAAYAEAVTRAQACLGRNGQRPLAWRLPLLVHFRPSRHLYRWNVTTDGTRVILPTPAMTFNTAIFEAISAQMRGDGGQNSAVTAAMLADDYQALGLELETAGGIVERTQGMIYDLAEAFERVNRDYFAAAIARPRLTWNRTLTGRKFGHYDFIRDTIMVSSTLDRRDVPAYVVDHVMHHELLHKKHGFRWQAGRRHAHTPEFRAEELTFPRYHEADQFLERMARLMR